MIGIYKIENIINHKIYIGKSIFVEKRFKEHKYALINNCHINKHLQSAWNKYGSENFEFSIIEECSKSNINEREIYWINFYGGIENNNNYNILKGGLGGVGNEQWKKKISNTVKEHYKNGDYNQRLNFIIITNGINEKHIKIEELEEYEKLGWSRGKLPISKEARLKASEKMKGVLNPAKRKETRIKISLAKKGKKTKAKGIKKTEEHCKNISKGKMGHIVSEETRKKISETLKSRNKNI